MKATGIVRRIDDLGRVVIPKEIRRTMRIREGDPLEIYTNREGEVIFKKYSPIGEITAFAAQYAETLFRTANLEVLICDRDAVIAVSGVSKKEYLEHSLSREIENIMEARGLYRYKNGDDLIYPLDTQSSHFVSCAMPIITEGDVIGCVISLSMCGKPREESDSAYETEAKLVSTAAIFLGKQMES
ncbi:MAG: AbrB/MazE/SpoVT family DNA-binding domain-containing protein [Clostridia bacterium]|nr:AbrB/MazE/SpoVT family DNA-binding domain-containing protein [Clostridia bacterium]